MRAAWWLAAPCPAGRPSGGGSGHWCRRTRSAPALPAFAASLADDLVPWGGALGGGNGDAAGEAHEVGRLADHGARLVDAKQQLVAFVKIERITDALGHRHLSLRRDPGSDVHGTSSLPW